MSRPKILSRARNLVRITYLELLFSVRVPEGLLFTVIAPLLLLVLLGPRFTDTSVTVPGLIGLTTAFGAMQGVGQTITVMRLTPIWNTIRLHLYPGGLYIAGIVISRVLRTLLVGVLLMLTAGLVHDFRFGGLYWLYLGLVLYGAIVFAFVGFSLAYLVRSPIVIGPMINLVGLVMMVISGVFFRPEGWLKAVSYVSPLTYLINLLQVAAGSAGGTSSELVDASVLLAFLLLSATVGMYLSEREQRD